MEGAEPRGGISMASGVTKVETPPTVRRHVNMVDKIYSNHISNDISVHGSELINQPTDTHASYIT